MASVESQKGWFGKLQDGVTASAQGRLSRSCDGGSAWQHQTWGAAAVGSADACHGICVRESERRRPTGALLARPGAQRHNTCFLMSRTLSRRKVVPCKSCNPGLRVASLRSNVVSTWLESEAGGLIAQDWTLLSPWYTECCTAVEVPSCMGRLQLHLGVYWLHSSCADCKLCADSPDKRVIQGNTRSLCA